jgi:RNA polymerase sigma-70 factor (ECF subfamily)
VLRSDVDGGAGRRADQDHREAELCRRFAPRIYLYGRRHLRHDDRARDLVQAVLLAVLQAARAGRVAEPEHADRFILGTSRHLAARLRAIEARTSGGDATEALEAIASSAPWATWNEARADAGALVRCLGTLDERSRRVVMLTFQDDCPADQIAAQLAMTAGNVRVTRHRAMAALRRCLDAPAARSREMAQ